ncbi:MAG: GAF domain-containing protein [Cyclobacteriaceae bacterium]|nr:GAF domain-containing protein [Cyclobacteriaceae bacterium]
MENESLKKDFFDQIDRKSDRIIELILIVYFVFGIFLSFFYETYLFGFVMGGLILVSYLLSKALLSQYKVHHYVGSAAVGLFMAQFIYQMHGLFEMHFTAFIGLIVLITYQNWKALIPLSLIVVVHHSVFAYIQYLGVVNDIPEYQQIYFTQLDYMDLQTFIFHASLYTAGTVIAGVYAYRFRKESLAKIQDIEKLNNSQRQVESNISFAGQIADGNYTSNYSPEENDQLGQALLKMRDSLLVNLKKEEEEKYVSNGLAKLAEIIRNGNKQLDQMCDEMIRFIVKYMQLNQGALFLKEEQNGGAILRLKGCFAYDRKKFLDKIIQPGEGLTGQCYLEKSLVVITDVPDGYTLITSGLGMATPQCLVLLPLIRDEVVEGVAEMASFSIPEKYQLYFLEKAATAMASAIANIQTSEKMKKLYEASQQQTEELRAQEEEMRQNMEELMATQESQRRLEEEMREKFKKEYGVS